MGLFARYYRRAEDPDGLIERVGLGDVRRTPWRRLSGGEQQRLALALALVGRPEVLFLDEPTAGVDPEGRLIVRDIVADQRDLGRCVVLTTHELAEAERLADHVVIVDHGRVLAEGSPPGDRGVHRRRIGPVLDRAVHRHRRTGRRPRPGDQRDRDEPGLLPPDRHGAAGPHRSAERHGSAGPHGQSRSAGASAPTGVSPAVVASLTAWLADRDLSLRDLRTDQSLEDAYLAITRDRREGRP